MTTVTTPQTRPTRPGPDGQPPQRLLIRRYAELLTLTTILFVVQTGLVPYDFLPENTINGKSAFLSAAAEHLIARDLISNIFLYFPLGLLLHCSLAKHMRSRVIALIATILSALAISLAIEWIQSYSPARVSTLFDLAANVAGATTGALVAWTARLALPRIVAEAIVTVNQWPRTALLKAYVVALAVFAAMPFSFAFTSSGIKKAVKSANFIPFQTETVEQALTDDVPPKGVYIAHAHLEWQRMKRWSRWMAETASFVLLAWLLQIVLRGDYGFKRGAALLLACWIGCGLAVGLSALQFLVISRATDVTDILFRILGLGAGLTTRWIYFKNVDKWERDLPAHQLRRLAKTGCLLAGAFIIYNGVIPLTFDAGSAGPTQSIEAASFLPFRAYFLARFDVMMDDVMEKFAAYAVFAALFALYLSPNGTLPVKPRMKPAIAAGVALSLLIEIIQMFITVRITSLTDPILALAGCLIGVVTLQQMAIFHRDAATVAPPYAASTAAQPRPLSITDSMVASLSDPDPNAPTEPSPTLLSTPKSR